MLYAIIIKMKSEKHPTKSEPTTTVRVSKFAIIGTILAIFNYLLYTFIALVIINDNSLLWLSSLISTAITVVLAYVLHSKITWKERTPTKVGVINFFIWNALLALAICPFLTWAFGLITPLYTFAYDICQNLHIPFDYNFVESTGIFILVNIVVMVLNFFFYDRLVFGKKSERNKNEK